MKVSNCAICGKTTFDNYMQVGARQIAKCRECGFLFALDIPLPEEMENHYVFEMKPDFLFKYKDEAIKRGGLILRHIRKPKGRLLDVGCGLGFFLGWAKQRGYKTYGVELSVEASEYAKKIIGLNVFTGDICRVDIGAKAFDIVTIQHVLEHIPKPFEFLMECIRDVLKDDGMLAIVVPNAGSLMGKLAGKRWLAFAVDEHVCHYTKRTLSLLLARSGFKVQKILTLQWSARDLLWAVKVYAGGKLPQKAGAPLYERKAESPLRNALTHLCNPLAWLVSRCGLGQEIIVWARKI